MGLITCPNCNAEYSEHLSSCPKCGCLREEAIISNNDTIRKKENVDAVHKNKKTQYKLVVVAFIVVAFIVFLVVWNLPKDNYAVESSDIVEPEQVNEIDEKWVQDSLSIVNRKTYDLTFFEVHGPVKEIIDNGKTYEFDKEGKLIRIDDYNPFSEKVFGQNDEYWERIGYERDDKGRICTEIGWESGTTYQWKDDRIISDEWGAESYSGTNSYFYDDRGFIVKEQITEASEGDDDVIRETINYSYPEIDEFGNWTYRKGGNCDRKRAITYYPIEHKVR